MGRTWSRVAAFVLGVICLPVGQTQEAPTPTSRALVIGAESYPPELGWTPLRGPVPDARSVADVLVERGGFARDQVRLLLDAEATREGILTALDGLVAAASPGDLLLVYFAGHGSQVLDLDGDELDGLDETLVPIDPVDAAGRRQDIRDDEISAFIRRANAVTDDVVLIFDCCNSGTNVRGTHELVARQAPRGPRADEAAPSQPLASREEDGSGYADEPLSYVALSACRSFQQAYEVDVDEGDDQARADGGGAAGDAPIRRGVFTTALIEELGLLDEGISYRDLVERVRYAVWREISYQTPVLEGPNEQRALLGGRAVEQEPFFALWPTREGWELQAGRLAGLSAGTELVICDGRASRPEPERQLGHVRIDHLGETASPVTWLTAEPDLLEVEVPLRAFAAGAGARPGALTLSLDGGEEEDRVALAGLVEGHRSLRLVERSQAAIRLDLDADRIWRVARADGNVLPLTGSASDGDRVRALVDDLAHLGRAAVLRHAWRDRDGGLELSWALELGEPEREAFVPRASGPVTADHGRISTRDGDRFRLVVENRSPVPVWVTLAVAAPDGEVFVVEASAEDEPLSPGATLTTPTYRFTLPEGAGPYFDGDTQRLVCIATRRFHDLRRLAQPSVAQRTRGGGLGGTQTPAVPADAVALSGLEVEVLARQP